MTYSKYISLLKSGVTPWNNWRDEHPDALIYLNEADLSGANLEMANLRGANLIVADLSGADLSGANLEMANLRGANLIGANLNGAKLNGAKLSEADLEWASLVVARLNGANLSGANLSKANLRGANLIGANLHGANLSGANLNGANLLKADFGEIEFGKLQVGLPSFAGCCITNTLGLPAWAVRQTLRTVPATSERAPLPEGASSDVVEIFDRPTFDLIIDPGKATPEQVAELFAALSDLNRVMGGYGLDFIEGPSEMAVVAKGGC